MILHENRLPCRLLQIIGGTLRVNVFQQDGILVAICHLLITFTNSLNPDQNVGPDLDPNGLTL